ncbi:restriction endonuclease subunit S [Vibrio paracholerae]|uniref:restriction endonuclease subunit S n=1 Tax=Vibrio paracholerae TaxID=650003 RepID=UPI001B36C4B3|nr:restriction endonuclease subunit S [Vibrio paracholerae]MBP8547704.1 restriction endonuclease subunit S [Vibrio paracholerae]
MSKYQAYPEYKDSGVEWLGEIPSQWKTCRLKHLASIKNGQDYKAVQSEVGYPVMGSGGQFAFATEFMYDKPSVLLGRKGTIDKPLYINEPFWTVDTMYYTEMQPETDAKYLYYLATTIQFARYSTNTALPSMTQEHLSNYIFAVPVEISDRTQIANFLDHETAKIDTLIEKQQQLIKLLKEKRQAVISRAVTKGLNPQAPMKDSGVQWLGEVPEHWVISPLKLYISTRKGVAFKSADFCDSGIKVVKASDIKQKTIREPNIFLSTNFVNDFPNAVLNAGDIVLSTVGSAPEVKNSAVGQIGMVPNHLAGSLLNQNTVVFTPRNTLLNQNLLFYLIQTDMYRDHLDLHAHGTANQASLNVADMLNFMFAMPSYKEQLDIVSHIEISNLHFDKLENQCSNAITLLTERRTALISAAVTGKIDVRNWQAPISQNQSA